MVFEIKDLAGLSRPLTKLIEVTRAAIGTLYKPRAIRTEADAEAYKIMTIASAKAQAKVEAKRIELIGKADNAQVSIEYQPGLAERALERALHHEIKNQQNIELIVDQAALALPAVVSDDPVNADWSRNFFFEAERISDREMQQLWGRVLAGETAKPGSFSLRTLNTLKNLSRREAELFRKACELAMDEGWIAIPGNDLNEVLMEYGLPYGDILDLRDAGLILQSDNLHRNFHPNVQTANVYGAGIILVNNGTQIQVSAPQHTTLNFGVLGFTTAGCELQKLITPMPSISYLYALANDLRARGYTVKRGTHEEPSSGSSKMVFEQDL